MHQTGAPESVQETKTLLATVSEAVRDSQVTDLILDNRETEAPREPLIKLLRAYFSKDGPLRDVALVLNSAPHRLRFNAVLTANASINVRAFGSLEEAEHWLTGWREWEEYGVCLYVFEEHLYGSFATDIAEVVGYRSPTEIPGEGAEVVGVVAVDSLIYRVLATPGAPCLGELAPNRLILGRNSNVALPAHQTPFVGNLRICDPLKHGQEVRSSSGNLVWVDFETLAYRNKAVQA